jgi:NADH-quinone oxidoreductase subunit G
MLDGPVKGIQMSCMLPVQDGMVVSTTDEETIAMRRAVIEWLMINHPHDCPVCDEGGECQLQDYTIAGGHSLRRYDGLKRTHINQYLGEQVEHEMNRCIQCYRCVRFYQEYAGGNDFGVTGRAGSVFFGRLQDGQLESPFSGNLVDICPTGVFTDRTARFRARYWDYDMAPSICPHCSLGCSTIPMARYRELLKTTARRNGQVNDWFICDRGRFSNSAVNAPERPRQALVDGEPLRMDAALDALIERLNEFIALNGSDSLAILGSSRMSLEGAIMVARLRDLLGAGILCYFADEDEARRALEPVSILNAGKAASLEDVRQSDLVVILECNLLEKAPMMALAVRQAFRNGARIFIDDTGLPLDPRLQQLFMYESVRSLSEVQLATTERAVIVCGTGHTALEQARTSPTGVKLAVILDAPNTFGAALLCREHDAIPFREAVQNGSVKGIISFECDLPDDLPSDIPVLAAADWQPTGLMKRADIILPVTAWVEMDGTFVNNEGRAQRFRQVMKPGLPIKGLSPELHPPRSHRHDAPGGDILPTWQIISRLMCRFGDMQVEEPFSGKWGGLSELDPEGPGYRIADSI